MSQNEARSSPLRGTAADNASAFPRDALGVPTHPSRHGCGGRELRVLPPVLLGVFLMACSSVQAKPKFNTSEIASPCQQLMICDLDGDGLKDLVLMDDTNLSIFYQDPKRGFTREPQQTYHLDPRPCLVWTAKLGGPAGCLLVMTSDGVTELCFTNRTGPPAIRQIIRQPTIIPEAGCSGRHECDVTFRCRSKPAATGRCCWCRRRTDLKSGNIATSGVRSNVISNSIDASLRPSLDNPGYTNSLGFDLSVGDVNGDGRDDLMVRRGNIGRTPTPTALYLQQTNGLFALNRH